MGPAELCIMMATCENEDFVDFFSENGMWLLISWLQPKSFASLVLDFLTHWGQLVYICVNEPNKKWFRQWRDAGQRPGVNWDFSDLLIRPTGKKTSVKFESENAVYKIAAILFRHQRVNTACWGNDKSEVLFIFILVLAWPFFGERLLLTLCSVDIWRIQSKSWYSTWGYFEVIFSWLSVVR